MVKTIAPFIGANGGGGRPDLAQTGGSDITKLDEAISALKQII